MMVWQPLPQHRASTATQAIRTAIDASADLDNDLPPDADQTDPNLYQNLDFSGWLASNNRRRSDETRGGEQGVGTCRSRWSPFHLYKTIRNEKIHNKVDK